MHVVSVRNVNGAYYGGLLYLKTVGIEEGSRVGRVLVAPTPVTTVYACPTERVLFDPKRDSNPFFSLFESLHMLAGRRDATFLDRFISDFSFRFAEKDGNQHGAYGFRWRKHFDMEGGGSEFLPDQLNTVVSLLRANPADRRAVIQMWDPVADLGKTGVDVPCNLNICLRVRVPWPIRMPPVGEFRIPPGGYVVLDAGNDDIAAPNPVLDMMVTCRSNDLIWGAYGANAVHFSILLEYLAGRIGVGVGTYTQVSFNAHAYLSVLAKVGEPAVPPLNYPTPTPIGNNWDLWDEDLRKFMSWAVLAQPDAFDLSYHNVWFSDTATPMFMAHWRWKRGMRREAVSMLEQATAMSPDWQRACLEWFGRRMNKQEGAA